jgi:hypothetical protein
VRLSGKGLTVAAVMLERREGEGGPVGCHAVVGAIQWLWSGGGGRCSPRLPQIPA